MVISVLAIAALLGVATLTWHSISLRVLSSDDYIVAAEDLETTQLPPWIRSEIIHQAFELLTASGGRLSIMDDDVTERVAQAFSLHPWVQRVVGVSKHHPARIVVDLEYRRPVCMVMFRLSDGKKGMYPVDTRGIVLPPDFTELEASKYPCLDLVDIGTAPVGGVGEHWGDERVAGAAEIAGAFGADWNKLELKLIKSDKPARSAYHSVYAYVLFTHGGTKILWGRPPGSEFPNEAAAADKIAWLKEFAEVRGSLDGSQPRMPLDVRNRQGLEVLDRVAIKKRPKTGEEKATENPKPNKSKTAVKRTATKKQWPEDKPRR